MPTTPPSRCARARHRLPAALLLLAVVLASTALIYLRSPDAPVADVREIAAAQPAPGGDPPGRELFLRNCAWCHGQDGSGSQYGPSLIGVGAASADFQLRTGRMPLKQEKTDPVRGQPAFPPAEIDALVSYIAGLGGGPPVPQVRPGDPSAGRTLYLLNCASCHSSTGTGAILPAGRTAPELFTATPTQIAEAIRVGPGLMPEFPEKALSSTDVDNVVAYVEALGAEQNRGGAPLERIGPVAEGFIAFFVAIPLLLIVSRLLGKKAP